MPKKLVLSAKKAIDQWLKEPKYLSFRQSLKQLLDRGEIDELNDAFYQLIPFGTGGRRGKMGVGTNRINERTIAESVQGFAFFLKKQFSAKALKERGVVITYDVRHQSLEFAKVAAAVFSGNGCKVYFFDDVRSTPQI